MLRKKLQNMLVGFACLWPTSKVMSQGLDLNPDDIRGTNNKKAVSVLQSRYFLKAWRPEIGIFAGSLLNEAYTDTKFGGARLSFFINEWIGFEGQYVSTMVRDSSDRKALNKLRYRPLEDPKPGEIVTVSPDPEINVIRKMVDTAAVFAPFYGKLNFMDMLILYTDIYLTLGASRVETDQGNKNAILFGAGERFYVAESWSVRVDARCRSFTETRNGEDNRRNSWSVDFGASYFFF